jgi:hypothetical protein
MASTIYSPSMHHALLTGVGSLALVAILSWLVAFTLHRFERRFSRFPSCNLSALWDGLAEDATLEHTASEIESRRRDPVIVYHIMYDK